MRYFVLALVLCGSVDARADAAGAGIPQFIEDTPTVDPHDTGSERYITLGVLTTAVDNTFGLRAQVDALSLGGFSLGAAGTLFGRGVEDLPDLPMFKASAVGYLAYTAPLLANIKLRAQVGYGGMYSIEASDAATAAVTSGAVALTSSSKAYETSTYRIVEGSLLVEARANHDWAFSFGPIVQRTVADAPDTTVMFFVGLAARW
ncbi:MAG TPA: hypothetical protein VGM90_19055 [Kofleriaceae bacterium]|jgi:hypothetical protein